MLSGKAVKDYISLVKLSHTIFAMPFALIGFFLAIKQPGMQFSWLLFLLVLLCMVFARNSAMAFNRYIDRYFDAHNPRTAKREIPAGIIKPSNALFFVILNCVLFIATTWFINKLAFYLSPVALFVILIYSVTKRFTSLCHLVLGLGLSLAPIGAFISVTGYFGWLPIVFSAIVFTWVSGLDIIYALQDEDFDKSFALKSIPVYFGRKNALLISVILHSITAILVVLAGLFGGFGWLYFAGSLIFIGLLTYQHVIVKPNDLSRVNIAFATLNGVASIMFAVFVVASILLGF